jgi:HlyD family type I secretion membrane fusion protein
MSQFVATSFADLLASSDGDAAGNRELRRHKLRALLPLAAIASLLILWAVLAPLSGAIIAVGHLKVELNRKTIQHQEGGIVREVLVRNGQKVRAGQPLIVISDLRNDAELNLLKDQLLAEQLRSARATAEAALSATFSVPSTVSVDGGGAEYIAREKALFDARRRTLDEQVESLHSQIRQAQEQAAALQHQIASTEQSAKLALDELALNEKLVRDGYVQRARLLPLERAVADYQSRIGESRSALASARQRRGELESRIAQAHNQYQQQATDEMKESSAKLREIDERLRPSRDQVERQYVRSPVDGTVMSIRIASVGEVVGPREPILDVVPTGEKLVVEARIRPQDINHVREGSTAEVRLSSFDARTTPLLPGKVIFVSPDRVTAPETGESWFVATVEVDPSTLQSHSEIRLQAGMPAELFVTTTQRTLFQYLSKPLNAFASRAMREP